MINDLRYRPVAERGSNVTVVKDKDRIDDTRRSRLSVSHRYSESESHPERKRQT